MYRYTNFLILSGALLLAISCSPKYPKCEKDENCRKGEFCVNGLCQQCRMDSDCKKGQRCNLGRCESIPGYCETDKDCGQGGKCRNNRCLLPGQCLTNSDCAENQECQNGKCVNPTSQFDNKGPCNFNNIYFDFDQAVLNQEALSEVQSTADCLKKNPKKKVVLEGHCDPRGTVEYNLSLGEARAESVKKYLKQSGVDPNSLRILSKGKLQATGIDESSWAKDRKVVPMFESK